MANKASTSSTSTSSDALVERIDALAERVEKYRSQRVEWRDEHHDEINRASTVLGGYRTRHQALQASRADLEDKIDRWKKAKARAKETAESATIEKLLKDADAELKKIGKQEADLDAEIYKSLADFAAPSP